MKNLLLTAAACMALAAASVGQTLPAYLPTDGLVGWWPFNGNANDESGNGNNGTVNGATLTEDRFGAANSAFDFNGVNNNITVPTSNSLENISTITISAWFFVDDWFTIPIGDKYFPIIHKTNTGTHGKYFLWVTENSLQSQIDNKFALVQPFISSIDEWHHIAVTIEGTTFKYYFDGVNIESQNTGNFSWPLANNLPLLIGNSLPGSPIYANGIIDDIAIYNRALTQEEITALYTGEPVNPPSTCNPLPANLQNGLVGYWPFCGNANDESGNGNNGTVNGATLTEDRFGAANSAFDFNGVNNNITVPTSNSLENISTITMSAWFFVDDWFTIPIGDKYFPILHKTNTSASHGKYFLWVTENSLQSQIDNKFALVQPFISGIDEWHHIAVTIEGTTFNYYFDGVNITSQNTGNFSWPLANNLPLLIGNTLPGYPTYANGKIDDITIHNRALTADEVQQLYTLNACTFTIYDTVTVTQTVYDTVSVSVSTTDTLIINTLITAVQPAQENTFLVYPNPAGSQITINNGNVGILGGYTMRITNSAGQEVYNQNITQTEVTLDLSNWGGNGLYVLYIVDPQGEIIAVKQIVLQ